MRRLTILLIIIAFSIKISVGQVSIKTENEFSYYFPELLLDSDTVIDKNYNKFWTELLISFNKPKLYNETEFKEIFRLTYWGNYYATVSFYKENDKYIIISDTRSFDSTKTYSIDTLSIKLGQEIIDSLNLISGKLWTVKPFNHYLNQDKEQKRITYDNEDILEIIEYHEDAWLLELKKGDKYRVLERTVSEDEVEKFIVYMMKLGKLSGYKIYFDNINYRSY